jgi:hypothetical protein
VNRLAGMHLRCTFNVGFFPPSGNGLSGLKVPACTSADVSEADANRRPTPQRVCRVDHRSRAPLVRARYICGSKYGREPGDEAMSIVARFHVLQG